MTRSAAIIALLVPAALSLVAQTPQGTSPQTNAHWSADPPHSAIGFRVRHLGITIDVEAVERATP